MNEEMTNVVLGAVEFPCRFQTAHAHAMHMRARATASNGTNPNQVSF